MTRTIIRDIRKHYPEYACIKSHTLTNYRKHGSEIAHEFQLYGGDSFANFFRGYGVPYREILMDVCDKKKVNYNKNSSTERIEMYLIQKLMDDVLERNG